MTNGQRDSGTKRGQWNGEEGQRDGEEGQWDGQCDSEIDAHMNIKLSTWTFKGDIN